MASSNIESVIFKFVNWPPHTAANFVDGIEDLLFLDDFVKVPFRPHGAHPASCEYVDQDYLECCTSHAVCPAAMDALPDQWEMQWLESTGAHDCIFVKLSGIFECTAVDMYLALFDALVHDVSQGPDDLKIHVQGFPSPDAGNRFGYEFMILPPGSDEVILSPAELASLPPHVLTPGLIRSNAPACIITSRGIYLARCICNCPRLGGTRNRIARTTYEFSRRPIRAPLGALANTTDEEPARLLHAQLNTRLGIESLGLPPHEASQTIPSASGAIQPQRRRNENHIRTALRGLAA